MTYEIQKNLHNNFYIFEKNKLPPRAYSIPYTDIQSLKKTDVRDERYQSDMVSCLSGAWDFKFYDTMERLPDKLNTLKTKFSAITIPSDWQRTGFQQPVYLNCPYEFKTFEPEIPSDMPVGVYRKFFEISESDKRYIISFLGVANNLSLYVNGSFAGYSEGSHNTAEFDISDLVRPGTNEMVVVSFKWCNGSFLEAQDMFRDNGIFRDVLLYKYDKTYLRDYYVDAVKEKGGYKLDVKVNIAGDPSEFLLHAELADKTGKTVAATQVQAESDAVVHFGTLDIKEWTPETPTTYSLFITLSNGTQTSSIRNITGFKTVEIKNAVFRFNERPVKLLGVNHHDTNLYKGYVLSIADMEKDIQLMKNLNVNAVRTSHYPPDPMFLTLADIYGLYVVDEADIETHGCGEMANDMDQISRQAKWASHYVDRVKRMYYRDRNHPCITMWSLGNEAGGYKCQDACYDFLKSTGTSIPVHYEGVVRTKRFHYDVISEMYTSTEQIEAMMQGKRKRELNGINRLCREYDKFPFYLCEYAHAMGVGPGNLKEYVELFLRWDNSMGGCIWEWADHAVFHDDQDKKYKYRYTYGGDHGEKQHDGHFCVDGLMYADRRLHTGAKEMQVAYRPLRAAYVGKNRFCFTNIHRFISSEYIDITWIKLVCGEEIARGELSLDIKPMENKTVSLPVEPFDPAVDCHVNFIYTDRQTGRHIATEQITLNDVPLEYDIPIGSEMTVHADKNGYTVEFETGKAAFNTEGALISYSIHGKELLAQSETAFAPNLYRALIDNDAANRDKWIRAGLDKIKPVYKNIDISLKDNSAVIQTTFALKAGRNHLYDFSVNYSISSLGAMEITAKLFPVSSQAVHDLPRFGLTLGLTHDFENVSYYGRGKAENMPDFNIHAPVGIYSDKVSEMSEPYVFPQESGMHCDVKKIVLSGGCGKLTIYAENKLAFSIRHFTQEALDKAQHQEDLSDMGLTYLTLDGFVRGIGSSSCGPDTRQEYRLDCSKGYSFSFTIIPE